MTGAYLLLFVIGTLLIAGMLAAAFKPAALPLAEGEPTQRRRYTAAALFGAIGVVLPGTLMGRLGIDYNPSSAYQAWWQGANEIFSGEFSVMAFVKAPALISPYLMAPMALFCIIYTYKRPLRFAHYAGGGMYASTESARAEGSDKTGTLTLDFYKKINGMWVLYVCEPKLNSDRVGVIGVKPLDDPSALTKKFDNGN